MTEDEIIKAAAAINGRKKSAEKTAAARENGKRGGRRKGTALSDEHRAALSKAQQARWERERAQKETTT